MAYKPCAVTLRDGTDLCCVYIVDSNSYIRVWGVFPEDDPGKRSISVDEITAIRDSPNRLPKALADSLYVAGESGMGYTIFTVEFSDGSRQAYVGGNAIDFIQPPPGLNAADARQVFPHQGRDEWPRRAIDYYWCLYEGVD